MKGLLFTWLLGILCVSGRVEGDCDSDLGMKTNQIPDKNINASSSLNKDRTAPFARQDGDSSWCSALNDRSPFLQITLDEEKKITEIVTQGSFEESIWVTQFRIKYYKEGQWNTYVNKDGIQILRGNEGSRKLKYNTLEPPVITRKIRIYPTASMGTGHSNLNVSCLRLELYGCSAPVDGDWGNWSDWSECSVTCGVGFRSRERKCDSPAPQNGGRPCTDSERLDTTLCIKQSCKVDGDWGIWSDWSECSITCGVGFRSRERKCDSPAPQNGGRPCNNSERLDTTVCIKQSCKVDGGWGKWSDWTDCDKTCGIGMQSRERKCDSPKPQNGGRVCDEKDGIVRRFCKKRKCPENEIYAGYSGTGEGWIMHSGDGGMKSTGSGYELGEWQESSGKTPFDLMYGDDED